MKRGCFVIPSEKYKFHDKEYYYSLPEGARAELIEGIIYDMSPAPLRIHQDILGQIFRKIANFSDSNNSKCKVYVVPFDVELSDDTVVQQAYDLCG